MTNKEAIEELKKVDTLDMPARLCEAYYMSIKALDQEPCEDEYIKVPKKALKYRTAGMVAYNVEWLKNHFDIERAVICGAQEPKTGHWIFVDDIESECSECGHREPNERFIFEDINFCAKCGAKMQEVEE